MYISYLEWSNSIGIELNDVNEKIIKKQENEILTCKQLVNNRDSVINLQTKIINENDKINAGLKQQVVKYKNRAAKWPYWLGGGFIGGAIVCLILTK